MAVIAHDIDRLDDINMLQTSPHTKFCTNFLLVLAFGFPGTPGTELLDSIDYPAFLGTRADETHRPASARAEDTIPLSILFGHVSMGCGRQRLDRPGGGGGPTARDAVGMRSRATVGRR